MKKVRILALVSAVVTALLLFLYLGSLNRPQTIQTASVVVAASSIPADTPISASMLKTIQLPPEAITDGAVSDQSQIIGKMAKSEIFTGEQLLPQKLVSTGDAESMKLAYAVEPGMRAITMAVDETSGLAYMLTPGDRIDIIGEFIGQEPSTTGDTEETIKISHTIMLMENITVLAVDNVLSEEGKFESDKPEYTTLTLEVTPTQAMELSEAQFEGQLRAILRSPVDTEETNQSGITLDDVMD